MRRAFYFDQSRCMACNACSVACKDWNQVNPGPVRWRTQATHEITGPVFANLSMSCNHCDEPACKSACSVNAITKRDDGVVVVDRSVCMGLQSCVSACPFATPRLAASKQEPVKNAVWQIDHPMQKCDFCRSRIDNGESPVCVAACGAHALESGDFETLMRKYPDAVQLNKTDFPYAYQGVGTAETSPMFLIRKRTSQTIS